MDPLQGGLTEPLPWLLLGIAFTAATATPLTATGTTGVDRGSRRGQGPQGWH